ncbi:hypothetical protein [Alteromonas sp. A079]|uniref:hypothetical protein n=1 Tax=Alteromonas sp. A079 TaxID=3410268 RepID=UPI003BA2833C
MATFQRLLVNLEIIADDLDMLDAKCYFSDRHLTLLEAYRTALDTLNKAAVAQTEASCSAYFQHSSLAPVYVTKQMLSVHVKLISYVLSYWEANEKVSDIINDDFDPRADKRLALLQVKAIRAKAQLKTVASAMGRDDYERFTHVLKLSGKDWQWDTLRARF